MCFLFLIILVLSSCAEKLDPADQLLQDGYYYYALGDPTNSSHDWSMRITDFSPRRHCEVYENADSNQVHMVFTRGEDRVDVYVSANDPIWDPRPVYDTAATSVNWSQFGTFEYFRYSGGQYLARIIDVNGMDVVVTSSFTQLSEITEFIESLDMVTPPEWSNHNPWDAACAN